MWTRQRKRSKLRYLTLPVLGAVMAGYFSFHAINGSLGLNSSEQYQAQLNNLHVELAALQETRASFERRTEMLSDGTLERDMIDEQARIALGMTKSNELILLHSSN